VSCSAAEEFRLGDYTMASIKDDRYMKFLGGYITYKGKGVPGLIKEKVERGLENIDKCLVHDEVRIYKEYFLPANRFILSTHDLTKTDLGKIMILPIGTSSLGLAFHREAPSYLCILGFVWM
jgi:hypothetical protein